jgi:hypothetical protein
VPCGVEIVAEVRVSACCWAQSVRIATARQAERRGGIERESIVIETSREVARCMFLWLEVVSLCILWCAYARQKYVLAAKHGYNHQINHRNRAWYMLSYAMSTAAARACSLLRQACGRERELGDFVSKIWWPSHCGLFCDWVISHWVENVGLEMRCDDL